MFCPFCGKRLCQRRSNPLSIPFSFCQSCGAPTVCVARPSRSRPTQTPQEWAAFTDDNAREMTLASVLQEFSDKASAAMANADLKVDLDHHLSFSPKTARDKLRDIVATHEEAILHMKRVHESELRTMQRRIASAEHVNQEWQAQLVRAERRIASLEDSLHKAEVEAQRVRDTVQDETEAKWMRVIEVESAAKSQRDLEVMSAWKSLLFTLDSAVTEERR